MEKKLVIIDGNSIAYRAFYGLPLLKNRNGEYTNAIFGFLNMMLKSINDLKPTHIVVVFDYPLKENFRTQLYADYKKTRKPMPDELKEQMPKLNDLLKSLGIAIYQKQGVEGDDVIGSIAKRFNENTIIITGDRDALQLIDETTSVLLTKKGLTETLFLTNENFFEHYGFDPINIVDLKSIMGDVSDNIPGVKGIGEKGANDLIQRFRTLENVYEHLDEIFSRNKNKLVEQKDMAELSKALATINTNVDIGEIDFDSLKLKLPFKEEARKLFVKYEFNSLLKNEKLFSVENKTTQLGFGDGVLLESNEVAVAPKNYTNIDLKTHDEVENFVNKFDKNLISFVLTENRVLLSTDVDTQTAIKIKQNLIDEGISLSDALSILKPILENEKIGKICFDYKLAKHNLRDFGINFCGVLEDAKIGEWIVSSRTKEQTIKELFLGYGQLEVSACGLIDICEQIKAKQQKMGLRDLYVNIELNLCDVLFEMEENGIKIDEKIRQEIKRDFESKVADLQHQIFELAGENFNLQSPKQVGEILFNKLNLGDVKWGTSIQVLKDISALHPIVPLIIEHRKYTKLLSTYIIPFEQASHNKNSLIHTTFNQTGTITGRLSSSNPNMQNIPARTGEGREVRKMFITRFESGEIVSADYSQIELRLLAHYSDDKTLVQNYINGDDVHTLTASQIFGVPIEEVTKEQRKHAKAVNFGIIYGISAFGLSDQIGVPPKVAGEFINNYYKHFSSVNDYMNDIVEKTRNNDGIVETLMGRKRVITELFDKSKMVQKFGERAARNFPFQGSASDIIKVAMININKKMKELNLKSLMCIQIHDELVFDCVKDEINTVKKLAKQEMESVIKLKVPLIVDIDSGSSMFDV